MHFSPVCSKSHFLKLKSKENGGGSFFNTRAATAFNYLLVMICRYLSLYLYMSSNPHILGYYYVYFGFSKLSILNCNLHHRCQFTSQVFTQVLLSIPIYCTSLKKAQVTFNKMVHKSKEDFRYGRISYLGVTSTSVM